MATRYFKSGSTLWNGATSWASTIGGTDSVSVPAVTDDVYFDASSGSACAITTTAGVCKTITCTGYTGTITMNVNLSVNGNVTLGAAMAFAGAGTLIITTVSSLTSNGMTFTAKFSCSVVVTLTFVDNWTFTGTTTFNACVLNRTTSIAGNLTISGTLSTTGISGTSQLTLKSVTHTGANSLTNPIVVDAGA